MAFISNPANTVNTSYSGYGAVPPGATVGGVLPVGGSLGSSGQFLTSVSNGTSWSTGSVTSNTVMVVSNNPPELEVKGRLVLNGQDLEERLKTIEKVLCIPERDIELEEKHPKLKKLYDEYMLALGKYRTFEAIKDSK